MPFAFDTLGLVAPFAFALVAVMALVAFGTP